MTLIQIGYHVIDAIAYFMAAAIPIYFIAKSNNNYLRKLTMVLAAFVLTQGTYHVLGALNFKLLAKGLFEPLSAAILVSFGVIFLLSSRRVKKEINA